MYQYSVSDETSRQAIKSINDENLKLSIDKLYSTINNINAQPSSNEKFDGVFNLDKNIFNNEKMKELKKQNMDLTKELAGIEFQIQTLESAKEKALQNFDIFEAVKMSEQINQFKQLRQTKDEIINNYKKEIAEGEKTYQGQFDELKEKVQNIDFSTTRFDDNFGYEENVVNDVKLALIKEKVKAFVDNLPEEEKTGVLENNTTIKEIYTTNVGEIV